MLGLQTTHCDQTWFSASKVVYRAPLCLPGEFLDSVLPPREFLDRVQSALRGLTLPPPHWVAPSSTRVPTALASAEYVFVPEDASIQPLSSQPLQGQSSTNTGLFGTSVLERLRKSIFTGTNFQGEKFVLATDNSVGAKIFWC